MNKCFNNYGYWHKPVYYAYLENKPYSENSLAPAPWTPAGTFATARLTLRQGCCWRSLLCTIPPPISSRSQQPLALHRQGQNRDVKTGQFSAFQKGRGAELMSPNWNSTLKLSNCGKLQKAGGDRELSNNPAPSVMR